MAQANVGDSRLRSAEDVVRCLVPAHNLEAVADLVAGKEPVGLHCWKKVDGVAGWSRTDGNAEAAGMHGVYASRISIAGIPGGLSALEMFERVKAFLRDEAGIDLDLLADKVALKTVPGGDVVVIIFGQGDFSRRCHRRVSSGGGSTAVQQ